MALAAHTNRSARLIILRSIGTKSPGFIAKNRRIFPQKNSKNELAYEILGYANTREEAKNIIFPN